MFKKLGLFGLFLLFSLGGVFAFAWREFTQLPDWYTQTPAPEEKTNILSPDAFDEPEDLATLEQKFKDKLIAAKQSAPQPSSARLGDDPSTVSTPNIVESQSGARTGRPTRPDDYGAESPFDILLSDAESSTRSQPSISGSPRTAEVDAPSTSFASEVTLNEQELNELMVVAANKSERAKPFLEGVQGIKTEIKKDKIKSEVVLNLSQVNRENLHASQLKVIDQLSAQFPSIAQDDLLLTLKGKPQVIEGRLKLESDTQVSIGGIQTSLGEISQRLGIDLANKPINLNLGDLTIQDLQYKDESLVLKTD